MPSSGLDVNRCAPGRPLLQSSASLSPSNTGHWEAREELTLTISLTQTLGTVEGSAAFSPIRIDL